jgi:hypothetical protein
LYSTVHTMQLTLYLTGIAAFQYSHVKCCPSVEEYNDYYNIVVDICDIEAEAFATRAQHMLVDYLRSNYGDEVANGVEIFGRETGIECIFTIACMLDAIITWVWKCRGVTSRSSARVLLPLGSSI